MSEWIVCSDFDGTICVPDSTEYLLSRFAPPEWKELDQAVWAGNISEREAYERQISLLRVTWPDARAALFSGVKIRDGFEEFVAWCQARELPLVVLSSGLRPLIDELLDQAGARNLSIECHDVLIERDQWTLILHRGRRLAENCSHCKCAYIVDQHDAGKRVVYVGDGFTDLCPARHADILFATNRLADECARQNIPFHPFSTFYDIGRTLESIFPR